MPQIRNASVARGSLTAAGYYVVYTVPEAYVLLLKVIMVWNNSAASLSWRYILNDPALPTQVWTSLTPLAADTHSLQQPWIPLNAGHRLLLSTTAGTFNYWIGGALLPTQVQFATGLAQQESSSLTPLGTALAPQPLPPGTRGEPTPILLPPPPDIVSPA